MPIASRTSAVCLLILTSLYGCDTVLPGPPPVARIAPPGAAPSPTVVSTLDAYKTSVAQHVVAHNPAQTFSGRLPPMLPAIVVLNITVDRTGRVTHVAVQRSRDPEASRIALASLERSGMLPAPHHLIVATAASLTFSETFLFNDEYRFQLRSIAGPQ